METHSSAAFGVGFCWSFHLCVCFLIVSSMLFQLCVCVCVSGRSQSVKKANVANTSSLSITSDVPLETRNTDGRLKSVCAKCWWIMGSPLDGIKPKTQQQLNTLTGRSDRVQSREQLHLWLVLLGFPAQTGGVKGIRQPPFSECPIFILN